MTVQANPNVTINIVSALTTVANTDQKVLFVGQQTVAATAVSGALTQSIQNDNSWEILYGPDSMLAAMIRSARLLNNVTQFDAIGLDDAVSGAISATGTITAVGTATEAGTLKVSVGSEQNHTVSVAVANGDTATVVASSIATAVTANLNTPVSAASSLGVVTFTAIHKGTYGNTLGIEVVGSVGGITTTVVAMASGATDPVLTGIFDVVGNTRYQAIVWPYADDTTVLRTFLDARFNVDNDVLDGVGFTSKTDTLANHVSIYGPLNSQSLLVDADKTIIEANYKGPSVFEIPVVKAAMTAALRARRLTDGANIADIVISRAGGLDLFGGAALASKPYFNTPLSLIPITRNNRGWTSTEVDTLNGATAGVSTMGNNKAGTLIFLGEQLTTYKTDISGNPDVSFKFLNFVDTASNSREFFVNNFRSTFAQSRLTSGDLKAGRDIANQASIEATAIGFYNILSENEFVLTQAGETARNFFIDNLKVTLDLANGKVTIDMQTPLVTQLRSIAGTMRIVFSTEG